MRVLNDFLCSSCELKSELLEHRETKAVRCKSCGGTMEKLIVACNFSLDPIRGHFPSATDKWAKHHEQMAKKGTDSDE